MIQDSRFVKNYCKFLCSLCFLVLISPSLKGQHTNSHGPKNKADSLSETTHSALSNVFSPKDAIDEFDHPDSKHSPQKAWIRSAIVPGWGQVYNAQYWKVPLIYGGFALLGRAIVVNKRDYNLYVNEGFARRDGKPGNPVFKRNTSTANEFFEHADNSSRNFQISIFSAFGLWGINCIDAYISAKFLHAYSIDNNLSIRLSPDVFTQPVYAVNYIQPLMPVLKLSIIY